MNWDFRESGKEEPLARRVHDVAERMEAAGCISKSNSFRRIRKNVPDGSRAGVTKVGTDAWEGKTVAMAQCNLRSATCPESGGGFGCLSVRREVAQDMFEIMSGRNVSATKETHEERVHDPGLRGMERVVNDAQLLIMAAGKETRKA